MTDMASILTQIDGAKGLDYDTARQAFGILLNGQATDEQISAFLTALHQRGETVNELSAGADVLREHVVAVSVPEGAIDTCGTGGDGAGTYNISTAVAFVTAACGVPVAKHGNKALSSKSGSAEVLEKLGVKLDITPDHISHCIAKAGMGFMFAPAHHSAMRHVAPVRAALGFRTIFNLLGPLANPAKAKYHLMGVFDKKWLRPMAETLHQLGAQAAWVVHGTDGLDEITTTGSTHIAQLKNGVVTTFDIAPQDAGLPVAQAGDLVGGNPQENAAALKAVLQGKAGAYRDIVLFNVAGALMVAGRAKDLPDGVVQAAAAIDTGKAYAALENLIAVSNEHYP